MQKLTGRYTWYHYFCSLVSIADCNICCLSEALLHFNCLKLNLLLLTCMLILDKSILGNYMFCLEFKHFLFLVSVRYLILMICLFLCADKPWILFISDGMLLLANFFLEFLEAPCQLLVCCPSDTYLRITNYNQSFLTPLLSGRKSQSFDFPNKVSQNYLFHFSSCQIV